MVNLSDAPHVQGSFLQLFSFSFQFPAALQLQPAAL